jgi:hypothetical protein
MLPTIINARSPYIISIEEAGSSQTEIYLYIWNGTGSVPAYPTYVLSKAVPTPTNSLCQYNISPYVSEFIDHAIRQNIYPTYPIDTVDSQWCNVQVKRYADGTLLDTKDYLGLDGYGFYSEGQNPINGYFLLDQTTFYYPYNITVDPASDQLRQVGQLTLWADVDWSYKYTNLITLTETTDTFTNSGFQDIPCVIDVNIPEGNVLEILDETDNRLAQYYFKPQEECYYNPITIDFVNKYGAWQRTFMFKASYNSLEVSNTEYNLLQADLLGYNIQEGQRKTFNTNGNDKIKMNSGWVDASYSDVLKQLMLSERILINGSPAICLTKTLDIQDSLNINLINYQMEFKYAYDTINSVI